MIPVRLWYKKGVPSLEIHKDKKISFEDVSVLSNKLVSKNRFCIGKKIRDVEFFPCNVPLKSGYLCRICSRRQPFKACAICVGHTCYSKSRREIEWCNQEFSVYLAYFGGHTTKVGVTASVRLCERLLEQGALAFSLLDKAKSGKLARLRENKLKKKFEDKMKTNTKIRAYKKFNFDWFKSEYDNAKKLNYNFNNLEMLNKVGFTRHPEGIGEVVGTLGQVVITKTGAFSFGDVKGRELKTGGLGSFFE